MLEIRTEKGGASFWVKVSPRASQDKIAEVAQGALKVRLTAPPVEGAANQALVKLLAKALGLARGKVRVIKGHKSRDKRVLVEDLEPDQIIRLLDP
ncbi:hypothetical protein AAU61_08070 [Desulfocarbo indianensis]|nr:hypothetical protein AAU61_08070 [Desulfocarbo indianensis]